MAKKKIFVSFDYTDDKRYKFLLEAWDSNPNFEFVFSDYTPSEIQSNNISVIKAGLTRKINEATYTLVIVGKNANTQHKDFREIGCRNWINFEIKQSKANGNKLIAIKLDRSYTSPDELFNSNAEWVMSFNANDINDALNRSAAKSLSYGWFR